MSVHSQNPAFFPMILPGSLCGGGSAALIVPTGVPANPLSLEDTQERTPGADVVSHPFHRYFWAARMGDAHLHPLWLPGSPCGSGYNFFLSLNFQGWLQLCDRRRS